MNYKASFLQMVERYAKETLPCEPSDAGLKQFHEYESVGQKPEVPDKYFSCLLNGKAWFEWKINYIADQYVTDGWPGFLCLAEDFKDDPKQVDMIRSRIQQRFFRNGK